MSYRPPSKPPKTDWGRFIVRKRKELDWSATEAFEAVRAGLGLKLKSRSAYLPYEFDRIPNDAQVAVFREIFGGVPDERDAAPPVDSPAPTDRQAELIDALHQQTKAINALVSRLDSLASQAIRDGVAQALAEAVALQAAAASQSAPPLGR